MRQPSTTLVVLAIVGTASVAFGGERPKAAKAPKIAVLETKPTGTVDPKAVTAMSSLIASEATKFTLKVISGSDLQTLLGFEKQKQLMGCSDGTCLAEIGGALGVEYLLFSEVGEFGGRSMLTLVLLDATKASAVERVSRTGKTPGEVIDGLSGAVAEVLKAFKAPEAAAGPDVKVSGAEAAKTAPLEPAETVTAEADPGKTRRYAGYGLVGGGAALLVGGAISGVLGKVEHDDSKSKLDTLTQDQLDAAKSSIDAKLWAANVLYGAGAVAAAVGLVVALTAPSADAGQPAPRTSFDFVPVQGGGAVVVSGGF